MYAVENQHRSKVTYKTKKQNIINYRVNYKNAASPYLLPVKTLEKKSKELC